MSDFVPRVAERGRQGDIERVSEVGVAYASVDQPKQVVHVTADLDTDD
jgi:hypothetical protein